MTCLEHEQSEGSAMFGRPEFTVRNVGGEQAQIIAPWGEVVDFSKPVFSMRLARIIAGALNCGDQENAKCDMYRGPRSEMGS